MATKKAPIDLLNVVANMKESTIEFKQKRLEKLNNKFKVFKQESKSMLEIKVIEFIEVDLKSIKPLITKSLNEIVQESNAKSALKLIKDGLSDKAFVLLEGQRDAISLLLLGIALKQGVSDNQVSCFSTFLHSIDLPDTSLEVFKYALFEMGICFRLGLGIHKSKILALYCLSVSAILGDPDAQFEVANCFLFGIGCNKAKLEAAKWFRYAIENGKELVGYSWIYKGKYGAIE